MNILDTIVESKKEELQAAKKQVPLSALQDAAHYHRSTLQVADRLQLPNSLPVIAEHKRRSPSKGWINEQADLTSIVQGYAAQGVAAISVLTDGPFFGGSPAHLQQARALVDVPLLRKDFTIEAYQLHEAKAWGADIVLLIAAILSPAQVQELTDEAQSLGLQVLLELHDEDELQHVCPAVSMVGINNRNLKSFEVNTDQSIRLQQQLPRHLLRVAESGIHSAETGAMLLQAGFDLLLMGEYFMKQEQPPIAIANFAHQLKKLDPAQANTVAG